MNMSNLLAMMVEFTSESWYKLVNDTPGGRGMLYRSRIHAYLEEISHICDLPPPGAPAAPVVMMAVNLVESGAVGRDRGQFQ